MSRTPFWMVLSVASVALVLGLHAAHYLPFIADDALISLRYAQRLLDGQGLTWTAGAPVEGYSNLLWILAVSGLGGLGVDLIDAARILGCLGMAAVPVALAWGLRTSAGVVVGGLFFALAGPVAVWAIGGLEQPFVAAGLAWTLALWARAGPQPSPRAALIAGLPLVVVCLSRPDGPLFTAVLASFLVWGRAWRAAAAFVVPTAVAVAGQLVFRLVYYGEWVPNTARLKAADSRLGEGLTWMGQGLLPLTPLLLCAGVGLWVAWRRGTQRHLVIPALATALVWGLYVAAIGGDIFPAGRHLVALVTLLIFPAAVGFACVFEGLRPSRRILVGALTGVLLGGYGWAQLTDDQNRRALAERWEWDGEVIGHLLQAAFGDRDPYLAVTAAGCVPYFSGLRALDMQGLNDAHIARQPPVAGFMIAHDHGDGAYVLDLAPDLLIFGGARGGPPKFVSGNQMRTLPRFQTGYQQVHLEGFDPHHAVSEPWIRLDGKLGLEVTADTVRVPGYLFAGTVGQPDLGRGLLARVLAGRRAEGPRVAVPPGRWQVVVDPPGAPLGVSARRVRASAQPYAAGADLGDPPRHTLDGPLLVGPGDVRLLVQAPAEVDVLFRAIELRAVPDGTTPGAAPVAPPAGAPGTAGVQVLLPTPSRAGGRRTRVSGPTLTVQAGDAIRVGGAERSLRVGPLTLMRWRGWSRPLDLAPWVGLELTLEGHGPTERLWWP